MGKFKIATMIGRKIVKHSPAICAIGGTGLTLLGIGLACKATYDHKEDIEECLKECHSTKEKEESKKEIAKTYVSTAGTLMKIYLPGGMCIFAGLFSMLIGHKVLSKRRLALIAAYESLNQSYKKYRQNVKEDLGKEADICYKHSLKAEKLNDETVYVSADDIFIPDRDLSDFAVFFGQEYSELCTDDPEHNLLILKGQEEYANAIFLEQGYIMLQDVYDMLGVDRVAPDGIGWVNGLGDNYVDFGIFNVRNGHAVNGNEQVFLLDFNHDGYILPYI